ncbi:putative uracil-DNA glycosylase [Helianthus annuus]|nr:putative uracil-DNA glycosylase [Helianthus annuus]
MCNLLKDEGSCQKFEGVMNVIVETFYRLIDENKHHILKAAHPSGLSAHRGFFGCRFCFLSPIFRKLFTPT